MRITKISVKGLFGMFDHEIPLNQESRITIVHGPNGVGKTVLMEMVHGLFNRDFVLLNGTPFEELQVELESDEIVFVEKVEAADKLTIHYDDGSESSYVPFQPFKTEVLDNAGLNDVVAEHFPHLGLVYKGGEPFFMSITAISDLAGSEIEPDEKSGLLSIPGGGLFLDRARFFDWYYGLDSDDLEDLTGNREGPFGEMPEWFWHILWGIDYRISTEFIRTQRLVSNYTKGPLIGIYSESVPGDAYYVPNPVETVSMFATIFQFALRRALESAANLENVDNLISIERSFKLFQDICNERLLFKSLDIKDYEFRFIAENGDDVPLAVLSSGEQHLLYLYFHLIFLTQPDTLVMIDEPELSMNVVWQRNFLKDLQRIIELRKFDVLIATHSPQIIHDKWDWMVPLGEKADD